MLTLLFGKLIWMESLTLKNLVWWSQNLFFLYLGLSSKRKDYTTKPLDIFLAGYYTTPRFRHIVERTITLKLARAVLLASLQLSPVNNPNGGKEKHLDRHKDDSKLYYRLCLERLSPSVSPTEVERGLKPMMDLVRSLDTETLFTANLEGYNTFSAFFVRITGTNGVTPATEDDIGTIRYIKNGETMINCTARLLRDYLDQIGGSSIFTSTASGALEYYLVIPRGFGDGNVDVTTPQDKARFEIEFGANFAGRVSGVDTRLYVLPAIGVNNYNLQIIRDTESLSAASQRKALYINQDNIVGIYLSDAQALPETLASGNLQGGSYTLNIGPHKMGGRIQDAISLTNALNQLEVAADQAIMAELYDAKLAGIELGNGLFDSAKLEVENGGGGASVAAVLVVGMRYSNRNYNVSVDQLNRTLDAIKSAKVQSGRSTAVKRLVGMGALPA